MVIDGVAVDGEKERIKVRTIGLEYRKPGCIRQFKCAQQVTAGIRHSPPVRGLPLVAHRPIAVYVMPRLYRRDAKARVWLFVTAILGPLYRDQRRLRKPLPDQRHRVADRKGVAIAKPDQVTGLRV